MPGNDDVTYFVALGPPLLWRRKLLTDKNSLFIEQAKGIKPEVLNKVFQEAGTFGNLLARYFQGVNPAFEESIIRRGVVIPGELQEFSYVFQVERRFGSAQISKDFRDLGIYVCCGIGVKVNVLQRALRNLANSSKASCSSRVN